MAFRASGLILLVAGCALHTDPDQALAPTLPQAYTFKVERQILDTRVLDAATNPVALQGLDPWSTSWDGRLEVSTVREFRDSSIGRYVRIGPTSQTDELRTGRVGPISSALSGLGFEIRIFPDGEILALNLVEHLTGPGREGEFLLPLWAALSPRIPRILPGEKVEESVTLPFIASSDQGIRTIQALTWTNLGQERDPDIGLTHHFRYEGTLSGKGTAISPESDWRAQIDLEGTTEGDVWLSSRDMDMARHDFHWDCEITLPFSKVVDQEITHGASMRFQAALTGTLVRQENAP